MLRRSNRFLSTSNILASVKVTPAAKLLGKNVQVPKSSSALPNTSLNPALSSFAPEISDKSSSNTKRYSDHLSASIDSSAPDPVSSALSIPKRFINKHFAEPTMLFFSGLILLYERTAHTINLFALYVGKEQRVENRAEIKHIERYIYSCVEILLYPFCIKIYCV